MEYNKNNISELIKADLNDLPLSKIELGKNGFIYLAGSIIEGFGNVSSDLDVFIVYDGISTEELVKEIEKNYTIVTHLDRIIFHFTYKGIRVDCEIWDINNVKGKIDEINEIEILCKDRFYTVSEENLDFIHCLKSGEPIVNVENFNVLSNSIIYKNLCFYQSFKSLYLQNRYLEDVRGSLASKDYGTTFFNVRILLEYAISGYLSCFGETFPDHKWIYRKLKRHSEKTNNNDILNKYFELQSVPFNEKTVGAHADNAISFCYKLNQKVKLQMGPENSHYFDRVNKI